MQQREKKNVFIFCVKKNNLKYEFINLKYSAILGTMWAQFDTLGFSC